MSVHEVATRLTNDEITERVAQVAAYERFSVFTFPFRNEAHQDEVLAADGVNVVSEGAWYLGYVEDWDDTYFYVNLK